MKQIKTSCSSGPDRSEQVFQALNKEIALGHWKVGDKLPTEAELCDRLHVSRTTVRRAIGQLIGMGLAKSVQGKGTFVCHPSFKVNMSDLPRLAQLEEQTDRQDIFEFRKIIECESAALAAIRAAAADIQALEQSILKMEANCSQQDIAEQDMAFHYLIAQASGNKIIQYVFETMRDNYAQMFEINVSKLGNVGIEHHRRILLAIQTRDMDAARKWMLEHLEDTLRLVCKN